MATLKNGKVYHHGKLIGEYKGRRGRYDAGLGTKLGVCWSTSGYIFLFYKTERALLAAIHRHLKDCKDWLKYTQYAKFC